MKNQVEILTLTYSENFNTYYGEYLPNEYLEKKDFDLIMEELNKDFKPPTKRDYSTLLLICITIVVNIILWIGISNNLYWLVMFPYIPFFIYLIYTSTTKGKRVEKSKIVCATLTSILSTKGIVVKVEPVGKSTTNITQLKMKQTVLVTGITAGGLGSAIAIKLAKNDNYTVYGTLRDLSKADAFKAEAEKSGLGPDAVKIIQLDVTNEDSCAKAVKSVLESGRIDILINNAGKGLVQTIEGTDMDKVYDCFEVNYFGVYRLIKSVIPTMRSQNFGRIVNISSVGGLVGQPFNEAYCSAKAALDSLSESMNTTLRTFNIKVTTYCPGMITTNFINNAQGINDDLKMEGIPAAYEEMFEKYVARTRAVKSAPEAAAFRQTPEESADDVVQIVSTDLVKARVYPNTVMGIVQAKFSDTSAETVIGLLRTTFK
ncbi:Retinol dehydrogenase 8 [Boothiomyces sp. JEL0866]|nr:Retinol dehydrogenase 8 [Boothiomyces sp. JEL0866]